MKDTWRAGLKSLEVERNVANLHHYAERSRHHTKDKQRLVLSVVAYDSLPGHHSGSIGRSVHFARVWTAISRGLRRGCKMAVGPRRLTPQQIFKAAQQPALWLISAEALRDAAEVIIKREDDYLVPYLRAHDEAVNVAMGIACAEGEKAGHAEIAAKTPNYPPAQVLYAYAIENALKGLIVANDPGLIKGDKLDAALKDHDLLELAERADFTVHLQEEEVLAALSLISVWAGRYPVALNVRDFTGTPNRNELMDYGSRHTIMRVFFDRAVKALEAKLPKPLGSRFDAVVVFRPPGT